MDDLNPRLRAVCDLDVAERRESSGRHEYDGKIQDLSRAGVRAGLAELDAASAAGEPLHDPHDEAHLATFEARAKFTYAQLELHRRNPLSHLGEPALACYDRDYAPAEQRDRARTTHLAAWPRAVDAAIDSLDLVSAPVAASLAGAVRGLAAAVPAAVRLGAAALTALMSSGDGIQVDLGRLSEQAGAERGRLAARLAESCAQLDPGRP